jgi:hypothetical protein
MKLAAGIIAVSTIAACTKAKKLADINVDIPYTQTVNVPSSGYSTSVPIPFGGVTLPFPAVGIYTNSRQYMEQYNTITDKVVDVNLKSMTISILSPAGENFNYLDTVRLYISGNGLSEQLVAYRYDVPKNTNTLALNTITSVNLKDYFARDTMYFRLTTHINAIPPTGGETLSLNPVLHLLANPLN